MSTTTEQLARQAQVLDHAANTAADQNVRTLFKMMHTVNQAVAAVATDPSRYDQIGSTILKENREAIAWALRERQITLPRKVKLADIPDGQDVPLVRFISDESFDAPQRITVVCEVCSDVIGTLSEPGPVNLLWAAHLADKGGVDHA